MPLLTIIGLVPTVLSIANGIFTILHNPAVQPAIQAITTGAIAIGTSLAVHTAVTAHQKIDAQTKKPLNDATKPGH